MNDTPRTDALKGHGIYITDVEAVRQLERELAAMTEARNGMAAALERGQTNCDELYDGLRAERDEMKKSRDYWRDFKSGPETQKLKAERDEADRRAGAAEREMASLKKDARGRQDWLDDAKEAAGFRRGISFDDVWALALKAYKAGPSLLAALTGLLKFHPESPEDGAELPPHCWAPEYLAAVNTARIAANLEPIKLNE